MPPFDSRPILDTPTSAKIGTETQDQDLEELVKLLLYQTRVERQRPISMALLQL